MKLNKEVTIFLSALGLISVLFILNSYFAVEKQKEITITEPYRASLTGEQVCLPPKSTDGLATLECARGIKTDEGEYYALDFDVSSQTPPDIQNGERFSADGVVTPIERLNTDQWQKYDIEGIFSITDSFEFEGERNEPITPIPEPSVAATCYIGGCSSQICSDRPDMISDCMFRPEYACYTDAVCERQSSGQCGWTETPAFTQCINSAGI